MGLSEVLLDQPNARTLVAETVVETYQIEARLFRELVEQYPHLSKRAWQMTAAFLTALHPWGDFIGASNEALFKYFR